MRHFLRATTVLLYIGCLAGHSGWAADDSKDEKTSFAGNFAYKTVKTESGLVFRVPEDMPIETRDGIQAPIPFDEYMYGKLHHMESRLTQIEQRMEKLEKASKSVSPAKAAPETSGNATNVLSSK